MRPNKRLKEPRVRLKYTDYCSIRLEIEFSKPCLGGFPADQPLYWGEAEPKLSTYFDQVLHRDRDGNPIITRGQLRGLIRDAARLMEVSPTIKDYVFVEDCPIRAKKRGGRKVSVQVQQVCVPVNAGGVGRGLTRHEAAPAGSYITPQFLIPTSAVDIDKFVAGIKLAGRTIGLGAHRRLGFGSFKASILKEKD